MLNVTREFLREKAEIEKDYAKKLEALTKKYKNGTKHWDQLLHYVLQVSHCHSDECNFLLEQAEAIKSNLTALEEANKSMTVFSQRLEAEQQKVYSDIDKMMKRYHLSAEKVSESKYQYEKQDSKLKRMHHQEILDLNNSKNEYILSLFVTNGLKHWYHTRDVQELAVQSNVIKERTAKSLLNYWKAFIERQSVLVENIQENSQLTLDVLDTFETKFKVSISPTKEPEDYEFQSCGLWKDSNDFCTDEYSLYYLNNLYVKFEKRLEQIQSDISNSEKAIQGLEKLFEMYTNHPNTGDADSVQQKILEEQRELMLYTRVDAKYRIMMERIEPLIASLTKSPHRFKPHTFALPTTCDFCQLGMWIGKAGSFCKDCQYKAHQSCLLKIPMNCKSVDKRQSLYSVKSTFFKEAIQQHLSQKATVLYDHDGVEGELTVREGDVVQVVKPDANGWSLVELNEEQGLVPTAYIACFPDTTTIQYDYTATLPDELSVKTGEQVRIINIEKEWVRVSNGTDTGLVPKSYCLL